MTKQTIKTVDLPIYLGCPVWNCDAWAEEVYPQGTRSAERLAWYTRTFNTVEGNSTFYGLPSTESVRRWIECSAKGFRFALKVPREISHEMRLRRTENVFGKFCEILRLLGDAQLLGPSFLQLPPNFTPAHWDVLRDFLTALPRQFPWAVEVRHADWFDSASNETRLDDLLRGRSIDKVLFDSRPLFRMSPEDEHEQIAQTRKPRTPHRETITANSPMVRIVGRNRVASISEDLDPWANTIAKWVDAGHQPYIFTHTPDDAFAPSMARMLADKLKHLLPGMKDIPLPPKPMRQQTLF